MYAPIIGFNEVTEVAETRRRRVFHSKILCNSLDITPVKKVPCPLLQQGVQEQRSFPESTFAQKERDTVNLVALGRA